MKTVAIIPARYASTRFPGKPLALLDGKPVVQWVYERAAQAAAVDEAIVATDDKRIVEAVRAFGGRAHMTSPEHRSGTDRCAEVAGSLPGGTLVVNLQGDEPFVAAGQLRQILEPLKAGRADISTLAIRIQQQELLFDSNIVKVVIGRAGQALYFSRSAIPYLRGVPPEQWNTTGVFYKHLGMYAFRREQLLELAALPPGRYEQAESLEQLRWLEAGLSIAVAETAKETIGIDCPEDLQRAERFLQQQAE